MTDQRQQLVDGEQYEVVQCGAKLIVRQHQGGTHWRFRDHPLPRGTIVRYEGTRAGIGHDNVDHDVFIDVEADVTGEFHPNSWGKADRDYLRVVRDE